MSRTRRRWIPAVGLGLLVVLLVLVLGVLPWWLAGRVTRGRFVYNDRENAGLTPASFQLAYQDVEFTSADGVPLRGWWVPAAGARGTVVLVHGLNRSRIEMVKKAPFLHGEGWNALLFDLRHHGASGGEVSSFGWHEQRDVRAAVEYARAHGSGPVVVWGVSLGGASAVLAAAGDDHVAAVVCDSSFRSLRDTAHHHVQLARSMRWWTRALPGSAIAESAVFWIGRDAGFDPDAVDVRAAAERLRGRPTLFVANSGDRRMPPEIAADLRAAAGPGAQLLVVPGQSHGGAWRDGTAAYATAVGALLRRVAR